MKKKFSAVKVVIAATLIIGTIPGFYGAAAAETEEGSEATGTVVAGLPAFAYNEDMPDVNPYLAAICEYLETEYGAGSGSVMIPAPVILHTDDSDAENVKVWGNFWTLGYNLEGTCLVCEGGGEAPGVMELTQAEDGGYEVTSFRVAGDGDKYAEDIRMFCEEVEGEDTDSLYEQYMQSNDLGASPAADVRKAFIEQYVADNDLDIDSFQDPGWDPIVISVSSAEEDKNVLESGSLDALRAAAEGFDLAVAYIGETYDITVDDWREAIPQGNTTDQWPFICDIDAEDCAGSQGDDIFCIVPTDPQAKVTVRELSLGEGEDFEMVEGDVIYESESGAPFLLRCNVSDIMPDTRIYVTDSNGDHIYSPSLSLEDGQLYMPDESEGAAVYDFTVYDAGTADLRVIEESHWILEGITDLTGTPVYSGPALDDGDDIEKLDLTLDFDGQKFQMTDRTNEQEWTGTYLAEEIDSVYKLDLSFDDSDETATGVCGTRVYADGSSVETITLTADEYIMSFVGADK